MIYFINLMDLTEKIDPHTFVKYLESTGWHLFPRKRTDIKIFQIVKSNGEAFQATIPLDRNLSDYKYAMYEAIKTVSSAEGQPTEQFFLFLLELSLQK